MTLEYILYDVTFDASDLILKLYLDHSSLVVPKYKTVSGYILVFMPNLELFCIIRSVFKALITKCVLFPCTYIQFSYAYSWEFFYVFLSWFILVSHVRLNSISSPTVNRVQKKPGLKMFVKVLLSFKFAWYRILAVLKSVPLRRKSLMEFAELQSRLCGEGGFLFFLPCQSSD